ncbi:TetR/AcrR family transcriptional regulator [Actinocorallia aurea]
MGSDPAEDRVLEVAAQLFGELGYDGITTDLIGRAAGVAPAEVDRVYGGKRGLYSTVLRYLHERDAAFMYEARRAMGGDRIDLHALADVYLDYCIAHPVGVALWMQRRMHDAADARGVDEELVPLVEEIGRMSASALRPGLDPVLTAWLMTTYIQTFVHSGFPDATGRSGRDDPAATHRFRAHLHALVDAISAPD